MIATQKASHALPAVPIKNCLKEVLPAQKSMLQFGDGILTFSDSPIQEGGHAKDFQLQITMLYGNVNPLKDLDYNGSIH
jgi:hypothetical protein